MMQVLYRWCAARLVPPPTLEDNIRARAEELHRDTMHRELQLIDDQHKIMANRAKSRYLLEQLNEQ